MPAHMASIHLRSMTRATPARMASTSSRPHSLPSQMARCKHQSHSLIDIPRPEREGLADPPCSIAHRAYRDGHRQVSTPHHRPHAVGCGLSAAFSRAGHHMPHLSRTHHRAHRLHPRISAPRMRPRVWCVLVVRSVRAATCAPVRPSGPPPPRMSGPPLSGHPRTPPAKCRPPLTRQPLLHPFSGVLVSTASHL